MIFLDTGFLFALFSRHDPNHKRVREVFQPYRGKRMTDLVLTTNHVVMETITFVRHKGSPDVTTAHRLAVDIARALYAGKLAQIHQAKPAEEHAAFGTWSARTCVDPGGDQTLPRATVALVNLGARISGAFNVATIEART